MPNWWLSWENRGGVFTLASPWWVTGYAVSGNPIICAAVKAGSEAEARMRIHDAYDVKSRSTLPSFRFVEPRPANWSPFGDRFPQAKWMRWENDAPA